MGSRLRGWTESGDLAQQVQYEALRTQSGKTFPNLYAFRGWLLRILRNLAATEAGRRGLEQVVGGEGEPTADGRTPSQVMTASESGTWMKERLEGIGERERQVVLHRVVDGLSFVAIGERLGISEGNARIIFHRSLQKLRESDGHNSHA